MQRQVGRRSLQASPDQPAHRLRTSAATGGLGLPLHVMFPSFYATTVGLPLALVGTIFLVIRLIDAFADPLIWHAADR